MKLFYQLRLLLLLLAFIAIKQSEAQTASVFPKGEISTTNNHTGTVWLKELATPDSTFNFSLAHATFAPAAKLDWHMHPAGQYLLITSGIGYYQERGKSVMIVKEGDIIRCEPGVEHWHGAAPGNSFAYLGVTPAQKGRTVWYKRVTSEEYNSADKPSLQSSAEQEIIALSKKKWQWMSEKNVDSLSVLFDEKAVFVHMGGSWGKEPEINIIRTGGIWYKKADIHSVLVNVIGNTAILLNTITLLAVVGGNEVVNPFIATEVYIKKGDRWVLGSLSFTKQMTPEERNH